MSFFDELSFLDRFLDDTPAYLHRAEYVPKIYDF